MKKGCKHGQSTFSQLTDATYRGKQPEIRHFREPPIEPPKVSTNSSQKYIKP